MKRAFLLAREGRAIQERALQTGQRDRQRGRLMTVTKDKPRHTGQQPLLLPGDPLRGEERLVPFGSQRLRPSPEERGEDQRERLLGKVLRLQYLGRGVFDSSLVKWLLCRSARATDIWSASCVSR